VVVEEDGHAYRDGSVRWSTRAGFYVGAPCKDGGGPGAGRDLRESAAAAGSTSDTRTYSLSSTSPFVNHCAHWFAFAASGFSNVPSRQRHWHRALSSRSLAMSSKVGSPKLDLGDANEGVGKTGIV